MIVRVTLEISLRREFDYLVPLELEAGVQVGSRVRVPLGRREVSGCVTALNPVTTRADLRPIIKIIGGQSFVTPGLLKLARWMAEYYCCAPETALKSVLPESVRAEKAGWRENLHVHLLPNPPGTPKLTRRQHEALEYLRGRPGARLADAVRELKTAAGTIRALEDKGLARITREIAERDPYALEEIIPTTNLSLNPDQKLALDRIIGASGAPGGERDGSKTKPFLIHGVTGSGKTEVYLQALAHCLSLGRSAIVLVPEISLTPQTVERFKARFSSGPLQTLVAVLHSHLSGEKHDEWHKLKQGRARIAIGARSAIFAPVDPLGLIIVDEEHENSYKQEEAPRYQARDVAVVRGAIEGAVVVLGSATPSIESYHNAKTGKYDLIEMPVRADDKKMPVVRVVDMRSLAKKEKGVPVLSPQLHEAVLQRLERKEQTMLFLNRRGFATSLQCPLCGYTAQCPDCSVSLTYHRHEQKLRCHICGHCAGPRPWVCPDSKCRNPAIRYAGLGTEKVEMILTKAFPHARIQRMDSDSLKRKDDYRRILGDFRTGKIDLLVGTQMIAKGLHFPNVTLVGIIHADLSLHMPDFRAGERTFQLLTQVSGRAGRGDVEGEVFIQAFTPFAPAIQYARRHDFAGFYDQELEFRAQLKYPPWSRVALLTFKCRDEEKLRFTVEHLKKDLLSRTSEVRDLILAGPAPAPLAKAETRFRYQFMLRTRQMTKLSRLLAVWQSETALPEEVSLSIDIDPVNLA